MSEPANTDRGAQSGADEHPPPSDGCRRLLDAERDALTVHLAEQHCDRNGVECAWYHGDWELLKFLGIVSSAAVHSRQLQALLQMALAGLPRRPRVLLSGCTDSTLLRILQEGVGSRVVDVVGLDLCATPLELMRAYATPRELDFDVVRANVLEYEDERGYDLILTHAFMGNFSSEERAALAARWFGLLRPGGCVATVQRIRPGETPAIIEFSAGQAEAFVRGALASAARLDLQDMPRVERAARTFAQKKRTFSITSRAEFERLFAAAGFQLLHLEYEALPVVPGLSGPSVPSGGEYAFLLAGREREAG